MKYSIILLMVVIVFVGCKDKHHQKFITINIEQGANINFSTIDSLINALPKGDSVINITGVSSGDELPITKMQYSLQQAYDSAYYYFDIWWYVYDCKCDLAKQ